GRLPDPERSQEVPGLRDARPGEQPDHAVLPERDQVAHGHAEHGQYRDRRRHHVVGRPEGVERDVEDRDHAAQLGGGGQVGGDRDRCAVVGGRCPGVEGYGGDLEGQAGEQQHDPGRGQRKPLAGAEGGREPAEVQRAGGGVEERGTEQRHGGGHDAHHEERDGGVGGTPAEGDQDVERQGQRLQRDDQRDEITGVAEHHPAGHRAAEQEVVLAEALARYGQRDDGERQAGEERRDEGGA